MTTVLVDLKGYELTNVRVDYGTSWPERVRVDRRTSWLRYEVTPKTFYGAWPIPHKVCKAKLDSLITYQTFYSTSILFRQIIYIWVYKNVTISLFKWATWQLINLYTIIISTKMTIQISHLNRVKQAEVVVFYLAQLQEVFTAWKVFK